MDKLRIAVASFLLGLILAGAADFLINSHRVARLNSDHSATLELRAAELDLAQSELQVYAGTVSEQAEVITIWQEREKEDEGLTTWKEKNPRIKKEAIKGHRPDLREPRAPTLGADALRSGFMRPLNVTVPLAAGPASIYFDKDVLDDEPGEVDLTAVYRDCARRLTPALACPPPPRVRWIDKPKVRTAIGLVGGVALTAGAVYLAGQL